MPSVEAVSPDPSPRVPLSLPPDAAGRGELAMEVHARPPQVFWTPTAASHVAFLVKPDRRPAEVDHLRRLCELGGVAPPSTDASHFSVALGELTVRWERHGEFSSLAFSVPGAGQPEFADPAIKRLPPEWLRDFPGETLYAAHMILLPAGEGSADLKLTSRHFGDHTSVGAEIGGGAGIVLTDFWIYEDGFARFLVFDRSLTARQAGRTVQRLFEIETYRMLALLAFPTAKKLSVQIAAWEEGLADLSKRIAVGTGPDELIMEALTKLAAEVESTLAATQTRFGASRAYHDLITRRIAELRERRIPGIQTIEEFMSRRLSPAMATIASAERRLHALSERVGQVSNLLSTRVDIAREAQNQSLLTALNRRAEVQFHLQRAVESLSVAAIVYYAAGLVGYVAKALKAAGLHIEVDLAIGLSIPILTAVCLWAVHRAHRRTRMIT
jgi:uncharacterized membrane-anchored protein